MSRIGKKEVTLPKGVSVKLEGETVVVKGPKGTESMPLVATTNIEISDTAVKVHSIGNEKGLRLREGKLKARHGLMRALLNNKVIGVSTGFSKVLELHGIGYKFNMKGKDVLELHLGYSNPVEYTVPAGIEIETLKAKVPSFSINGSDKELVGKVASEIRKYRKPDSYKGKGVRYAGEVVRLKSGKS
jgi:large subunit ribosomal protein L6